jgi:hypothetical protein
LDLFTTTSAGGITTQKDAVEELFEEYWLPGLNTQVKDVGEHAEIIIWGESGFEVLLEDRPQSQGFTNEFLYRIAALLKEDSYLDLRVAGSTDDSSVIAYRYFLTPCVVTRCSLEHGHRYLEPPTTLADCVDDEDRLENMGDLLNYDVPEKVEEAVPIQRHG